jgi:hypothetical protein
MVADMALLALAEKGEPDWRLLSWDQAEKKYIMIVLELHKGNIKKAAIQLKWHRSKIYRRMEYHGIHKRKYENMAVKCVDKCGSSIRGVECVGNTPDAFRDVQPKAVCN